MKANRVFIRSYCECGCDCPTCHTGDDNATEVENCVYCQLKWAGKGQYDPKFKKKQGWGDPAEAIVCKECGHYHIKKSDLTNKEKE